MAQFLSLCDALAGNSALNDDAQEKLAANRIALA
jgi:hypothetical protein